MKRLIGLSMLGATLAFASTVLAQTSQAPAAPTNADETRPAMTTASGTTGIWFVPTGEVLPARQWSASLYRTNIDDGQGFSDISAFPVTFAYGLKGHAELFGSWSLVTRIDRDTRPLFFASSPDSTSAGTGGGIVVNYPLNRYKLLQKYLK